MALSSSTLAQLALSKYKAKMAEAFPDVVKGGTVRQIPKEDGTTEYEAEEQRGPIEVDEEKIRPLFEAMAEAVVEHLISSGQVPNVTTGTSTGRIT